MNDDTKQVDGFVGLSADYVEGIFVSERVQSKGVGKQLLDYVKCLKSGLSLRVYQKNTRAVRFYQRENFLISMETIDGNTNQKEYLMVWEKTDAKF